MEGRRPPSPPGRECADTPCTPPGNGKRLANSPFFFDCISFAYAPRATRAKVLPSWFRVPPALFPPSPSLKDGLLLRFCYAPAPSFSPTIPPAQINKLCYNPRRGAWVLVIKHSLLMLVARAHKEKTATQGRRMRGEKRVLYPEKRVLYPIFRGEKRVLYPIFS